MWFSRQELCNAVGGPPWMLPKCHPPATDGVTLPAYDGAKSLQESRGPRMSITLDQVTKRYQGVPVVNDVSLNVHQGEFLVLLGPSGSGKSTLLRAIAGLTEIDHGRVSLRGRDVTHTTARQREVGFVFQHYALFR